MYRWKRSGNVRQEVLWVHGRPGYCSWDNGFISIDCIRFWPLLLHVQVFALCVFVALALGPDAVVMGK